MQVTLLKGKIHRCTITHADLEYEGSVTISAELMKAAGIVEHEQVHLWNVSSGKRLTTYAMRGARSSGVVCVNGAAAHHMKPGELVIIAAFASMSDAEARQWTPKVVFVDARNRMATRESPESPGPQPSPARVAS
ncbi:MAG TPA: aspartate 1-decarboxylase [Casimicrobiaceae bacterium]